MKKTLIVTLLGLASCLSGLDSAHAQVAGTTTTVGVTLTEATQVALGWSVKRSLLGKTVYNDSGEKIGKVQDLIIAPDRHVSYVIVGAGGFIGIGRHDVAVPITQIEHQGGKIVMPGATKSVVSTMPPFNYVSDTAQREKFLTQADKDLAMGKERLTELQGKAAVANAELKAKLDSQSSALQLELRAAEEKISQMKRASANRWREFERDVSDAMARLRRSIDALSS